MAKKRNSGATLELSARRLTFASRLMVVVSVLTMAGLAAAGAVLLAATRRLVDQAAGSGKQRAKERLAQAKPATVPGVAALRTGSSVVQHAHSAPGSPVLEAGVRFSRRVGLLRLADFAFQGSQQVAQVLADAVSEGLSAPGHERRAPPGDQTGDVREAGRGLL